MFQIQWTVGSQFSTEYNINVKQYFICIQNPLGLNMNLQILSLCFCTSISIRQLNIIELSQYLTTDFVNVPIPSPWPCTTLTMCYVTVKCSLRNTGWIPCSTSCYNSSLHLYRLVWGTTIGWWWCACTCVPHCETGHTWVCLCILFVILYELLDHGHIHVTLNINLMVQSLKCWPFQNTKLKSFVSNDWKKENSAGSQFFTMISLSQKSTMLTKQINGLKKYKSGFAYWHFALITKFLKQYARQK